PRSSGDPGHGVDDGRHLRLAEPAGGHPVRSREPEGSPLVILPPGDLPVAAEGTAEEPIVVAPGVIGAPTRVTGTGSSRRMWRRFRRNKIAMIAAGFILFV